MLTSQEIQDTEETKSIYDTFACEKCSRNIPYFNKIVHEIQCERFHVEIQELIDSGNLKEDQLYIESDEDNMFVDEPTINPKKPLIEKIIDSELIDLEEDYIDLEEGFIEIAEMEEEKIQLCELLPDDNLTTKRKNRKNRKHKTSNDEADCILLNPKSKPRKKQQSERRRY